MSQRIRILQQLGGEFERLATGSADAAGGPRDVPPTRRRRTGWLRTSIGAVPVLAGVLVPLVVVGAALLLLGRSGHGAASPPPGAGIGALIAHTPQRQLRRELSYIQTATASVLNTKACRVKQPPNGVTYVHGSPDLDLLSILGLLRRPATPSDRLPATQMLAGTPDIYRAYIRRAFSLAGTSYYIVPTRVDPATSTPPARCFELQAAALDRELPKIPASLRQPTRELQAGILAYDRGLLAHAPRDTICLVTIGGYETGASCGTSAKEIEYGQGPQENGPGTYFGVVPDGVATVTLVIPALAGQPTQSVTVSATSNVYAVHIAHAHAPPPGRNATPTVIWRSGQGRVLKRISPPTAADAAAVCKQQPVACLLIQTATATSSSSTGEAGRSQRKAASR